MRRTSQQTSTQAPFFVLVHRQRLFRQPIIELQILQRFTQELFESLFSQDIQLVHGLKAKMKNKLMPMWDKIMLRKRYIIECINELLKNKANLVHSRHRSIHNFIMNLCSALTAYCFFDNKPEVLPVYVEKSKQLELFAY